PVRSPIRGGGEERHQHRLPRQLDARLHAGRRDRRVGRQRRRHADAERGRRRRGGSDLARRDERGGARAHDARLREARRHRRGHDLRPDGAAPRAGLPGAGPRALRRGHRAHRDRALLRARRRRAHHRRPADRGARLVAVTLVCLTLVAGLVQTVGNGSPRLGEPSTFTILPEGSDVARLAPITVTFPSAPKERAPESLFQLLPETKGTYAWMSARTLLFQPDFPGLVRGGRYTVAVPERPEAGLSQPATKKFTVTGQLAIQQVIPGDGDSEVPTNAQIFVQFNRSVAALTTLA